MAVPIPHRKMHSPPRRLPAWPYGTADRRGNAVRFDPDGTLHGDNFVGAGFVAGLRLNGHDPAGMKVLMVGAGGAARAIALALCEARIDELLISNRTPEKAAAIAGELAEPSGHEQARGVASHDGSGVDMIAKATKRLACTARATRCRCRWRRWTAGFLVLEIIMIPERTAWLADAEGRGLKTHYGRHMLDCQVELIGGFHRGSVTSPIRPIDD